MRGIRHGDWDAAGPLKYGDSCVQAHYRDYGKMWYARSMLTIHNMAYQGRGPLSDLRQFEIPDNYIETFRLNDPVGGEHMNIMKAGIITATRIVAVSGGYSWEIQTPEGGWGLHQVLQVPVFCLSSVPPLLCQNSCCALRFLRYCGHARVHGSCAQSQQAQHACVTQHSMQMLC